MTENYIPPYTLTDAIVSLVERIGELLGRSSLLGEQALRLRRVNRIRTVHGSVAIEGNTLTEEQVTAVMEGKRVLASPREIQEVKNALKAYGQLSQWQPVSEADLIEAHSLLTYGLLDSPGFYRTKGAGVMGREGMIHVAPPADLVPFQMKQLLE
ncbi:MAG: hypothetical protein K9M45_11970 [Kiritimatiellales bacterium]|nr:hypothetical protein [Kiritimatiellales bacterium]